MDDDKLRKQAEDTVEKLKIKTDSINKNSGDLSGGNQQKVVIGKWINTDADILSLMNRPAVSMSEPK